MEALLVSIGVVALAEIGDKTQLLSFILAARFRKPWPIIWGILIATIFNHGVAGSLGVWLTRVVSPTTLRWALGIGFVLMAGWMLIPDKLDDTDVTAQPRWGVFGTTLMVFFLAEMGDKTQIATVALAAQFQQLLPVVLGTTIGMMIANVPAVLIGGKLADRLPVKLVHAVAAVIFLVLGVLTLSGAADSLF